MTTAISIQLPKGKLAEFKSFFYSRDELRQIGKELQGEEGGWKGAIKARMQMGSVPKVRDVALYEDLRHRLTVRNLDYEHARFVGWYSVGPGGEVVLDLSVVCWQPSLIYRLFLDDHVYVPLKIVCSETADATVLSITPGYKGAFDFLGCGIAIVLLFMFIVPGLVWWYMTRSARRVRETILKDVVFEALRERLAGP